MQEPFPYDMRAVLTAPGKALSLKKIFVASWFLLLAYITYLIFTYIALMFDGVNFTYIRDAYGLFPVRWFPFDAIWALIIYLIGLDLAGLFLSLAIMGVAVIDMEQLRGDHFFSARRAIGFAFSRIPTLILVNVSIIVFVGFVCFLGLLVGLIGRIPELGNIVLAVFYTVPTFITLILTVFVGFVTVVGIVLLPVVLAAQKRKEVFDGLLQLFSVMIREPVRFFFYLGISAALAKIASFVYAYFVYRTVQVSKFLLTATGGENVEKMFISALNSLPFKTTMVRFFTNIFPGIDFGFTFSRWGYGGHTTLASVILAAGFLFIFLTVIGYAVAVLATGLARGYAVIRRMKDDYFICEEDPLHKSEDFVNPPFEIKKESSS